MEKHGDQDVIQVEGMVLMERPTKLGKQRKSYFENLRNQQSSAIDESIRRHGDSAGVNIKIKRQSTVTKGRDAVNIQD